MKVVNIGATGSDREAPAAGGRREDKARVGRIRRMQMIIGAGQGWLMTLVLRYQKF